MVIAMLNKNVKTFKETNCEEDFVIDLAFLDKCVENDLYSECKTMYDKISKLVKVEINKGETTFRRLQFTKMTKKNFDSYIENMIVIYFNNVKQINPDRFDVLFGTEFFSTQQCVELININVKWFQKILSHQARQFEVCLALITKDYSQFFFIDSVNAKLLFDEGLLKKEDFVNICKWEKEDNGKLFGDLEDNYCNSNHSFQFQVKKTTKRHLTDDKAFQKRRVDHFEKQVKKRQKVE